MPINPCYVNRFSVNYLLRFCFFADKKVKRRDASRMSQLVPRRIFRRYVIVIMNRLRAIERILAYFLQGRRGRYVHKVAAVREYGGRNLGNVLGDYYAVRRGKPRKKER